MLYRYVFASYRLMLVAVKKTMAKAIEAVACDDDNDTVVDVYK